MQKVANKVFKLISRCHTYGMKSGPYKEDNKRVQSKLGQPSIWSNVESYKAALIMYGCYHGFIIVDKNIILPPSQNKISF
jgi:hypothetical protein